MRIALGALVSLGAAFAFGQAALAQAVPNLTHLDSLLVPLEIDGKSYTGLAIYAEPDPADPQRYRIKDDPDEGLTALDDVARAVVVYVRDWSHNRRAASLDKARALLELVLRLQAEDGEFYNFVFPDGRINDYGATSRKSAGFWAARAVWALAESLPAFAAEREFAGRLEQALSRAIRAFSAQVGPRYGQYREVQGQRVPAWFPQDGADIASILAVGLAQYLTHRPQDAAARTLLTQLCEGLTAYQPGTPGSFPFLLHLPDAKDPWAWHAWASRQVQALALAGKLLNNSRYTESARAAAGHMLVHLLASGLVEGFTPAPDPYPQIAYGMESLASGFYALAESTGEGVWAELGGLFTDWLFGLNSLGLALYDPATGRVYDGLERRNLNRNAGAESTVSGLLALLGAQKFPAAQAMLGWRQLERVADRVLEAEAGTDFGAPPDARSLERASGGKVALLGAGAALNLSLSAPPGDYLVHLIARTAPGAGRATLFAGQERVGQTTLREPGEPRLEVRPMGRLRVGQGPLALTLSVAEGALEADALWVFPAVERLLLGRPGERLLLLKSWNDTPQALPAPPPGAQVRAFDRLEHAQDPARLPPYGFALLRWESDEALPLGEGGVAGERFEVRVGSREGPYLLLDLGPLFDGDAFSTSSEPLRGNFDNPDGPRGATYPAERLSPPGSLVRSGSVPFRFPPTDTPRNMLTLRGQRLELPPGRYASLHLLGAAEQGSYREEVRLEYRDGTVRSVPLGLSDWCQPPQFGERVALVTPFRRSNQGTLEPLECRIFAQTLPLDPTRELSAIVLPSRDNLHLFALTLEQASR
jgi:hypothetical protein